MTLLISGRLRPSVGVLFRIEGPLLETSRLKTLAVYFLLKGTPLSRWWHGGLSGTKSKINCLSCWLVRSENPAHILAVANSGKPISLATVLEATAR